MESVIIVLQCEPLIPKEGEYLPPVITLQQLQSLPMVNPEEIQNAGL